MIFLLPVLLQFLFRLLLLKQLQHKPLRYDDHVLNELRAPFTL